MHMIYIVGKSAIPLQGRIGPTELQDWYAMCAIAAHHYKKNPATIILIVTDFKTLEDGKEADRYVSALRTLGVPLEKIQINLCGSETIAQLECAHGEHKRYKRNFTLVCTLLHLPRVLFLCARLRFHPKVKVAVGIPRPWEFVTDSILTIAFPIIDLLGMRTAFQKKVLVRRSLGKV